MAYQFGSVSNEINREEEVILQQETSSTPTPEEPLEKAFLRLTKEELEFLLTTMRSATFKGSEVERVFTLTLKLQQMYLNS